jgi:folate-dependent phosphoribosylglycinamide formyltransferase PurN
MSDERVVMLIGGGISSRILYHGLKLKIRMGPVIEEAPVSRSVFVKRRISRLGLPKVAGQIAFQMLAVRCLNAASRRRVRQIIAEHGLCSDPIDPQVVRKVDSVNSEQTISLLRDLNPKVVLVNGTRIISEKVLKSVDAVFINTHVGITPLYRGVHGAYWSLVDRNPQACGVTVHLIDRGIDSGAVLEQALIQPTERDNFTTYPLLQMAAALPLVERTVQAALAGSLRTKDVPDGQSRLWTHPTLGEYLWNRFRLGVK